MGIAALKPEDVTIFALHSSKTGEQDIGVKEIDRLHRNKGLLCIGYHYVIRRDGTVETGRPLTQRGVHLEDRNHCSIGICFVGNKPTDDQAIAADQLLLNLERRFPNATLEDYR